MIKSGKLKTGDAAMVYGVFSQAERGQSEKGLADTLEKAGLKVDRLEITQEANSDPTLAIPVLTAYVQSHPQLKAIGTQHGGVTAILADVLKKAGKRPGEITVGGIDLAPATIDGLKSGYVTATLDQLLYLQGFVPVLQCVMTAKYKMPGLSLNTGAGVVTSAIYWWPDSADRRRHPLKWPPGGRPSRAWDHSGLADRAARELQLGQMEE